MTMVLLDVERLGVLLVASELSSGKGDGSDVLLGIVAENDKEEIVDRKETGSDVTMIGVAVIVSRIGCAVKIGGLPGANI